MTQRPKSDLGWVLRLATLTVAAEVAAIYAAIRSSGFMLAVVIAGAMAMTPLLILRLLLVAAVVKRRR